MKDPLDRAISLLGKKPDEVTRLFALRNSKQPISCPGLVFNEEGIDKQVGTGHVRKTKQNLANKGQRMALAAASSLAT